MEEKEKSQTKEQKRIIKNLCFDSETGRFILVDNQNNSFLCDMFGRQKNLFKRGISGIYNRYKPKNKLRPILISSKKENEKLLSPLKLQENYIIPKQKNFNTIASDKSINYHPIRKRYDDRFGLPKPLVPPFFNENNIDFKEKNKKELIEHLNTYFSDDVCKNNISLGERAVKPGLSYLTIDLNDYKLCREDHKEILKLIDDTIEKYREQYKNKLSILYNNPIVKAIANFKKFLLLNKDVRIVNGFKISEPPKEIKEKNEIISHNIKKYFDNIKEKNIINAKEIELYRAKRLNNLDNADNIEEENELFNEAKGQGNQIIVGPDKLNNMCKSKDFTIGRLLEMDFGFNEEDHRNKLNRIKRLGNSAFSKKNNNKIIKNRGVKLFSGLKRNKNNLLSNSKMGEEENLNSSRVAITYKDTLETLSNKYYNPNGVHNNNNYKSIEQKIADNELSFISEVSERENNIQRKRIFKIKSVESQRLKTETENELLKGFERKEEIPLEETKNVKKENKFRSFMECYKNDIDLLKKTNPIIYEMEKKAKEHEYLMMKKKIELMKVLEKNKRKNEKKNKNQNKM